MWYALCHFLQNPCGINKASVLERDFLLDSKEDINRTWSSIDLFRLLHRFFLVCFVCYVCVCMSFWVSKWMHLNCSAKANLSIAIMYHWIFFSLCCNSNKMRIFKRFRPNSYHLRISIINIAKICKKFARSQFHFHFRFSVPFFHSSIKCHFFLFITFFVLFL